MRKIAIIGIVLTVPVVWVIVASFKTEAKFNSPTLQNNPQQIKKNINLQSGQIKIENLVNQAQGEFGVVVQYLETGERVAVNANEPFYAASVTKVPLLITLYRLYEENQLTPETKVTYLEEDAEWGDGTIQNDPFGTKYTLEQVAWHLAKESDNVAKNMLYRILPWEEIAKTFRAVGVEPNTAENIFTTEEMAKVWEYLYKCSNTLELSAKSVDQIFELLANTTTEERIPAAVPEGVKVAHKIGTWSDTGSWHDCGIVFLENPVLVCVMGKNSTYEESLQTIRNVTTIAISTP
ncbi:MAG: serine hydrolase [bacterium]